MILFSHSVYGFSDECVDPNLDYVSDKLQVMLCSGEVVFGRQSQKKSCSFDGDKDCFVTSPYKSINAKVFSADDLKKGKSVGPILGINTDHIRKKLVECRNGFNSSKYNNDSMPPGNAGVTTGTIFDWWDTIGDHAGITPAPNSANSPWEPSKFCNGSQIEDVTNKEKWLTPSGKSLKCSTSTCPGAASEFFTKVYFEPYSNLYFTNPLVNEGAGAALWSDAVEGCYTLDSGDGIGKWRLPTLKESHILQVSGLAVFWEINFSSSLTSRYWLATSKHTGALNAYRTRFDQSSAGVSNKTSSNYGVFCIR